MNIERSALRGEKAVCEHDLHDLKQRAAGMRNLLRIELPAYLDVANIDEEKVSAYSTDLVAMVAEIKATMVKLKSIEEQLDG
jgi:pyoverdine/dityrosine biosynthesis protein Dit1